VDACRQHAYDLILMDVQMPVMDGYEAAGAIRQLEAATAPPSPEAPEQQQRTPIVAMTANALKDDRDRCLAAGMDDFITKPIKRQALLNTVTKWAGNGHTPVAEVGGAPTSGGGAPSKAPPLPMDLQTAVEEFGDRPLVLEVANELLSNGQRQLKIMEEALKNGDLDRLRKEAHAVKGGAWTIEARPLGDLAETIEHHSRERESDPIGPLLERFVKELDRLESFLRQQTG
jgi:two-component system, sensor histidine kinase and response regulator